MLYAKACGVHTGESVLALSFLRNLTVSTNVRISTAPSLVLACVFLFTFGLCQSLLEDRRTGSTLSFYNPAREPPGQKRH